MALIPFDIAIGGLNSLAGILGATEQDRRQRRQLEEAARQREIALRKYAEQSRRAEQEFQRLELSNAFNADQELDLIKRSIGEGLVTDLGNQNAWLRGLGYKPDDTPSILGGRALTSDAALKGQKLSLDATNAARERRRQAVADLRGVQNQEAGFRSGMGTELMREGMSMPANNLQNTLQNIIGGGLGKRIEEEYFKKKVPGVGATASSQSRVSYAPGSLADSLERFRNVGLTRIPGIMNGQETVFSPNGGIRNLGLSDYNPFRIKISGLP